MRSIASSVGVVPDSVPTWALGCVVLGVFALDGLDGWVAKVGLPRHVVDRRPIAVHPGTVDLRGDVQHR